MASSTVSFAIAGTGGLSPPARHSLSTKSSFCGTSTLPLNLPGKSHQLRTKRLSVCAKQDADKGGNGGMFVAGFLMGGALFGVLGYVFAPQVRKFLLNENEHGFQKATRPVYYDDGIEKFRQTLSAKTKKFDSVIDNVMTRLTGGKKAPPIPVEVETDESAN